MSAYVDSAMSGIVHTVNNVERRVNQFENNVLWLGRTLVPEVGFAAKNCFDNVKTTVPYVGSQVKEVASAIGKAGSATVSFFTPKGWKVIDRTSKEVISVYAIAQLLLGVPVDQLEGILVLKNIADFVGGRNIFDRIARFKDDWKETPFGLKKIGFVAMVVGNIFETSAYLNSKGLLQPLINLSTYPITWLASTAPGTIVFGVASQAIGYIASTAAWSVLVQIAAQTGSIPLLGPVGQAIFNTATQMTLKQYKDLFVGISFTLSCIEVVRQLTSNNPPIVDDAKVTAHDKREKLKWTMYEQGAKVALILAGNGVNVYGYGFAKTFVKTAQFVYMAAVVNTIAFVKVVMFDMQMARPAAAAPAAPAPVRRTLVPTSTAPVVVSS